MKRMISIFLFAGFTMQVFNIHVNDIKEIGHILEHSQYHSDEYGDSFFDFISKHYGELADEHEKHHHSNEEGHQHNPFSHVDCNSSISVYILDKNVIEINKTPFKLDKSHANFYQDLHSNFEKQAVFQPPKTGFTV